MDDSIKHLVGRVKEGLIETYGEKIKQVKLCGFHVRGEAARDSDVDILILKGAEN